MRSVGSTSIEDFKNTNLNGKLLLGSLATMTAYEWGPGNETVTPLLITSTIDATTGIIGSATTAAIAGGFTAAQQLTSAWLARKNAVLFPRTTKKSFSIMNGEQNSEEALRFKEFRDLPASKQAFYSFVVGSSFAVLREAAVTGRNNDESHLKRVGRRSAAITAGIVSVAAFGADISDQLVTYANATVDDDSVLSAVTNSIHAAFMVLKSPYTWLAVGGALLTKDYWQTKIHKRKNRNT